MIYLASPYSHPDPIVRGARFKAACEATARLMREDKQVFSPIAHSHSIAEFGEVPGDWDYWREFDRWFIERCEEVIVLRLNGWFQSVGVQAEIAIAQEYTKIVRYMDP